MEDLDLRRVINSLAVFKTAPLNRLGNHPNKWSRMQDLNLRLLAPKASVLPNCTNSRTRATMKVIATATKRIRSYSSKPYISRKCLSGPMDVCILTFCMLRGIQVLSSVSFALSVSRSVLFTNLRFVKFALIYDHSVVGGQPLPPLSPSSLVLVDSMRFELMTSSLRTRRSSNWTISPWLPRRDSNPHQSGYEPLLEPFQFTRRGKKWLEQLDSNQCITDSKSVVLPLDYAPSKTNALPR